MWFIFPQIAGLGHSAMATKFALSSLDEAVAYLAHPVLGRRLLECSALVASVDRRSIAEIFGHPDDMKFRSSMTLFSKAAPEEQIFVGCLQKYFGGEPDQLTLARLGGARESGGPDHDAIVRYIRERHPDTVIATAMGATFFSCDESNWPNFATLVTTDEHDTTSVSNLARPGVFRLNISLSRERFAELVGGQRDPDFTALDTLMPHPVYAAHHWACILNPSTETFDRVVKPLLDEAHDRVAKAAKAKRRGSD
jgi:uncharacterized protein (DUF1810 family)